MAAKVPVLLFSGIEHFRNSLALVFCTNNDIELKSFTNVAIDERTESKAKESNSKTEEEKKFPGTNCQFFLLITWLR